MLLRYVLLYVVLSYYLFFVVLFYVFFFKQKTAYEMRISDWSSDVCSSDLGATSAAFSPPVFASTLPETRISGTVAPAPIRIAVAEASFEIALTEQIGRASCRERVCQYV